MFSHVHGKHFNIWWSDICISSIGELSMVMNMYSIISEIVMLSKLIQHTGKLTSPHTIYCCYNKNMGKIKTTITDASVEDFINTVEDEAKRADSFTLLKVFSEITNEKPKMWGTSIIGFGQYHYKSERSSQEGDWMLTGFSPRKQSLSLYLMMGFEAHSDLLNKLGKHKTGMGCLYINKLGDVDQDVLKQLIKRSFDEMKTTHPPA